MTDLIIPPLKKCTKCGTEYPATPEYFHRNKHSKDALHTHCKICKQAYSRENSERLVAYSVAYLKAHPEKRKEQKRKYRERHPDRVAEQRRNNYQARKSKPRGCKRDWVKMQEASRRWLKKNRAVVRVRQNNRRARKMSLPYNWSKQQWFMCLDYWHHCCAVCGNQLRDLFGDVEPQADHWIALTDPRPDNPGTVPTNMICLCNSCNHTKQNKIPEQWLNDVYGKHKAMAILNRVRVYFDWIVKQKEV